MNITELSVSDWIVGATSNGMKPQQVSNLTEMSVDTEDGILYFPKQIYPLDLTETFLRNNNFVSYITENRTKLYRRDNVTLVKKGEIFLFLDIPLRYVHSLQHLLRIVGYTQMANTFEP